MGDSFFVTFLYEDNALAEPEWLKSIWLEIKADDVPSIKQKILTFGVEQVNSGDKSHLFFRLRAVKSFDSSTLTKIYRDSNAKRLGDGSAYFIVS